MSRLFIDRPIFAWVLAIIVMLGGLGALRALPLEQYPDIAPTQVNIRASYPGASAETIENSVTQVLEQQLTGIDGLLYFSSQSSSRGQASITAIFAKGTDPDIAQVQVQNKIQTAVSRLPQQVQQQGVRVTKSNSDSLLLVGVYDETNTRSNQDVSDYMASNIQDPLSRVEGVGDVNVYGAPHAMRIWLNPQRLAAVSLMPSDVINAISAQNSEIAAGDVGGLPAPQGQMLNATVTAQSRLQTPEEFEALVLKTLPDGATVRIKDVARVEIGAESYTTISRINGHPGAGMSISLSPGADALETADRVKTRMEELAADFPDGLTYGYTNDSTAFIKLSVKEVQKSLFEAILLVVLVMFVFLQSWRAVLIPAIAVPVVLLGTFAVFYILGFSINTLTLFGLTLAIGLLVDDAIVVVENVERLMEENPGMSAREATIQSMKELQVALIAIALVLSAVFLPMAFFGGSTGVIYRQFSVTIVSAMALSVLVALILSPALTSTLLKPRTHGGERPHRFPRLHAAMIRARDGFNTRFDRTVDRYVGNVTTVVDRKWLFLAIYALLLVLLAAMFVRLPGGFLPNEDQGRVSIQFRLPAGATQARTLEVRDQIERYLLTEEKANVQSAFLIAGGGGGGASGQNTGQGFVNLVHWDDRPGKENSADAIAQRARKALSGLRDAQVFALVPGAVRGLGDTSGFTMELQNRGGMTHEQFAAARDRLLTMANANAKLQSVRLSDLPDVATLKIDIDTQRLTAYGLSNSDVNSTLATAWGGRYVNDFIDKGRVKRVYVQGDAPYRARPEDIGQWYVRSSNGQMAPFSAFADIGWSTTPSSTSRFQGVSAFEISGQPAPGTSSGEAMNEMERMAAEIPGTSVAWAGASYQERLSSGQAPLLYALSLLVVFLCLAALYESWSIPLAVLLVIPLGLVGSVFAVSLRGLQNDVYLQIGLLTTMGLAAKNAILMIEFAEQEEKKGKRVIEAAVEAARIRLRPILMTSFAFIFGVLPLALATGAGANSRVAIGTAVIGGMMTAAFLAIFFIPLFFVLVRRGVRDGFAALRARFGKRGAGREAAA
ncbi:MULTISPECIES: multidrug efflux RND transporter permease subunit [Sphingopyxis]|uniref:Efflux pump membrane transporter n=1 Tax=Sphingopyxis granuli TaxID=267128 RepID=A0AA86GNI0_9SPHN|nr:MULTISPECIES: multidrug efflux RND transporter permease subunit [Sphingopyxis]AMG76410.1 Multidrug transporter [Sphingopyxis granuli]APW73963.1 multidrug efflux RND transporter permease subunit [Sphingopyxis granuli]AVA15292.1 multidrug efflux RND transporter permease subunit [Sphingopyxis sp. MG]